MTYPTKPCESVPPELLDKGREISLVKNNNIRERMFVYMLAFLLTFSDVDVTTSFMAVLANSS